MKPRYELHFDTEVIHGDIRQLKRIIQNTYRHYELFVIYRSRPAQGSNSSNLKMKFEDIQNAQKLLERGYSKQSISKKYKVNPDYLSQLLKQYQTT